MTDNWYEVWVDDGLPQPYVLIVLPKEGGAVIVFDPKESKPVHEAPDYERARLWLLEDEYTRVEGRMTRDGS